MSEEYPIDEDIYVLKNDKKLGPFDVDELLDKLESEEFSYDDVCLREGAIECERIRDLLDWEPLHKNLDSDPDDLEDQLDEDTFEDEPEEKPERKLAPSSILYRGHPSILNNPIAIIAIVGGVAGGSYLYSTDHRLTLVGFLIAIAGLVRLSFLRFTNDYLITPRRIELIKGLLARSSQEVRIADIRAINVSCSGLAGIIGVGSVEFFTSGDDPEIVFQKIWKARKVKRLVRKLQDESP
ncbi:MAG: hypothetical protein CMO55_10670 [Verrucomicrobiales bacterium]|nr:hypothetical protein [Verrucomicrobiales bacterium]